MCWYLLTLSLHCCCTFIVFRVIDNRCTYTRSVHVFVQANTHLNGVSKHRSECGMGYPARDEEKNHYSHCPRTRALHFNQCTNKIHSFLSYINFFPSLFLSSLRYRLGARQSTAFKTITPIVYITINLLRESQRFI